ncbi:hypothetical protein [Mycobacterium sp. 1164985.4]|uniref:hypothetical protein n=1 Tax=Mycobacterium sp. 1164985.4 TaxID=1834069 RepID=UPI0007FBFD50|nr:hypothetical protein [Mycobacterium sp. 1164985.4]OBK75341.1 hypothetical protein A5650_17775 [Mycobacterium sp. 1164985.4]
MASDDDSDLTRRAPSSADTGIIRRHPSGEIPTGQEPRTSIIRRHPTGAIPIADPPTQMVDTSGATQMSDIGGPTQMSDIGGPTQMSDRAAPDTTYIPRARPVTVSPAASPKTAIATAVASILTGWTTAVIATDLITGWWRSDQLFCVAIGFLTAISAAALIAGLIGLLLRRWVSRLLVMVGAMVALLIFSSLFVAGAKLPAVVYAIPLLPVASIVFAALPATGRWERSG